MKLNFTSLTEEQIVTKDSSNDMVDKYRIMHTHTMDSMGVENGR